MNVFYEEKSNQDNLCTTKIKTLIVDDYTDAIDNIKSLLSKNTDIEITGEAISVKEAIKTMLICRPDLVFLDIEMPELSGFDLINELLKLKFDLPGFIFTTGHIHYAIDALRNNAVDFLLKPIDPSELSKAIFRYKKTVNQQKHNHKVKSLAKSKRILIPTITGLKQISLCNVAFFQKENNATENIKIHYSNHKIEIIPGHISLRQVNDMLPEKDFFQTDRCTIINLNHLTDIETKSRTCILSKCNETIKLPISRARLKVFKNTFSTF